MQFYFDPDRESDPYALPDGEVFELTAREAAELDGELVYEYSKRHEFRLANMNSKMCNAMLDAIIEEQGIKGGWFWWACFPGCLPDSDPIGPFDSAQAAIDDARATSNEMEE